MFAMKQDVRVLVLLWYEDARESEMIRPKGVCVPERKKVIKKHDHSRNVRWG